jgi:O-antigen/teichoic acid export membrane protein
VSQVMIGRVSQKLQDDPDPASAFRLVRRTMQLAMVSGGALSAMIIGLAPWIINTVFGAGFSGSIDILRVFALMFPLAVFTEVVRMHILVPHLKDKQVTAISLTGALLHIVGTLWLSAQYGAIGAAWSRVGVEVFMATLSTYFIHRAGLLQRVWPSPLT